MPKSFRRRRATQFKEYKEYKEYSGFQMIFWKGSVTEHNEIVDEVLSRLNKEE